MTGPYTRSEIAAWRSHIGVLGQAFAQLLNAYMSEREEGLYDFTIGRLSSLANRLMSVVLPVASGPSMMIYAMSIFTS